MTKQLLLKLVIMVLICHTSSYAACESDCIPYEQRLNYIREPFTNYDEESKMTFKLRALGAILYNTSVKNMAGYSKSSHILQNGFGLDGALSYFILDNRLAIELSSGLIYCKNYNSGLRDIANHYQGDIIKKGRIKQGSTYIVPVTATGQFHIAPYGGVQPYIGAGYHVAYMRADRPRGLTFSNHYGPVIQMGIDFAHKDVHFFNIDIKQYFVRPTVSLTKPMVVDRIKGRLESNPLIVSAGFGFRF